MAVSVTTETTFKAGKPKAYKIGLAHGREICRTEAVKVCKEATTGRTPRPASCRLLAAETADEVGVLTGLIAVLLHAGQ